MKLNASTQSLEAFFAHCGLRERDICKYRFIAGASRKTNFQEGKIHVMQMYLRN